MAISVFRKSITPLGLVEAPGGGIPGVSKSNSIRRAASTSDKLVLGRGLGERRDVLSKRRMDPMPRRERRAKSGWVLSGGSSTICNKPWYLDRALKQLGNLASYAGERADHKSKYALILTPVARLAFGSAG